MSARFIIAALCSLAGMTIGITGSLWLLVGSMAWAVSGGADHRPSFLWSIGIPAISISLALSLVLINHRLMNPRVLKGYCLGCGYDLRGNYATQRCPECGREV